MADWLNLPAGWPGWLTDAARYANGLLLLTLLLVPLERFFGTPAAAGPTPAPAAATGTNVAYYFINSLITPRLTGIALALLVSAASLLIPAGGVLPGVHSWPWWMRLLPALAVSELCGYWAHRALHAHPWLWRLHRIHHSPARMNWLVNTRAHPLELVFSRSCSLLPLYVLGFAHGSGSSPDALAPAVALVTNVWGFVIHANLRWRWRPLHALIATPAFHHAHHAHVAQAAQSCNYAALLPLIDRLFGTYAVDPVHWPARYGIDETLDPGLAGQLLQAFGSERR